MSEDPDRRPRAPRQQGTGRRQDARAGGRRDSRPRGDFRGPQRGGAQRGERFRRGDTPQRREGGRESFRPPRDEELEERQPPRPGTAPAADEPDTPEGFEEELLPMSVRAELKGLPKDLADIVGAHVLAAGELIDTDPGLAHRHAEAARRRAGRLPVVREAAAETAYAAGKYEIALREFRALRRMNGSDAYLPVMADCERALGRYREALDLLATLDPKTKDLGLRIECLMVEAGIRSDLGQRDEALRLLQNAISRKIGPKQAQARLRYAYADLLEEAGRTGDARAWFEAAEKLDADGALDTTERIANIDGIQLPEDMSAGVWDDIAGEQDPEKE